MFLYSLASFLRATLPCPFVPGISGNSSSSLYKSYGLYHLRSSFSLLCEHISWKCSVYIPILFIPPMTAVHCDVPFLPYTIYCLSLYQKFCVSVSPLSSEWKSLRFPSHLSFVASPRSLLSLAHFHAVFYITTPYRSHYFIL